MDLNEQNVVVEMAEDMVSDNFGKGFTIGVLTTVVCGLGLKLVNKFVVKPIINKAKGKKEDDRDIGEVIDNLKKDFDEEDED